MPPDMRSVARASIEVVVAGAAAEGVVDTDSYVEMTICRSLGGPELALSQAVPAFVLRRMQDHRLILRWEPRDGDQASAVRAISLLRQLGRLRPCSHGPLSLREAKDLLDHMRFYGGAVRFPLVAGSERLVCPSLAEYFAFSEAGDDPLDVPDVEIAAGLRQIEHHLRGVS